MSRARFAVVAPLDGTVPQAGTVTVDRASGLVSVRPKGRRRTYEVTLGAVATMVCQRVLRAEVAERRKARKRGR